MNDALAHDPSLEEFRPLCQKVSGFYFLERYPLPVEVGITDQDVRDCISSAKEMIGRLRSGL